MTEDLTIAEFVEAKRALEKEIGLRAELYVTVGRHNNWLSGTIYPRGIGSSEHIGYVRTKTFRDLLAAARTRWEQRKAEIDDETTKKVALAIIRLTHEHGECTDAALRQEFDAETVARYGEEAVKRADEMSDRRPFRIVPIAGANAA